MVEKKVKLDIRNAIMKTLHVSKEQRELSKHTEDSPEVLAAKREKEQIMNRDFAFNKTLEEETKQMSMIGDTILRRKKYQEKYNNRLVIDE